MESIFSNKSERVLYSEQELIEGCQRNDSEVQKALFEKYYPRMMGVCMRYAKNQDEAQDLVQEGFIKVFDHISRFRKESSLDTWVTRIFINNALSFIKKEYKKNLKVSLDESWHDPADEAEDWTLAEETEEEVNSGQVVELMQELPVGYRTVLNLYAIENYSHKEIAKHLNISEGTSKSQLARARKLLRQMLMDLKPANRG